MKKSYTSPNVVCNRVQTHELICTSTIPGGSTAEDGNAQANSRNTSDWEHYEQ